MTHEFEGDEEGLAAFFAEKCACQWCRQSAADGFDLVVDSENKVERFEVKSIWETGCACEWDCEEIA